MVLFRKDRTPDPSPTIARPKVKQFIQPKESPVDPFFKPAIQTKLKVGESNDKFEKEADRVADKVVSQSKGDTIQRKGEEEIQQKPIASEVTPLVQKSEASEEEPVQKSAAEEEKVQMQEEEEEVQAKSASEEESVQKQEEEEAVQAKGETEEDSVQMQEEEEEVQAKSASDEESVQKQEEEEAVQAKSQAAAGNNSSTIETRLNNSKGGGQKLSGKTKNEMESGFGSDFSNVNIHTDDTAAQLSKDLGAKAFAHGNDIYFNKGQFNPESSEGKHLLAHELTHTIQQKGMVQKKVQRANWKDIPRIHRLKKGPTKTTGTRKVYTNYPPNSVKQMLTKANISCSIDWKAKSKRNPVDKRPTQVFTLTLKTTNFTSASVKAKLDKLFPSGKDSFMVKSTHSGDWKKLKALVAGFQKSNRKRFSDLQIHTLLKSGADPNECIGTMNLGVQNLYGNKTVEKGDLGDTAIKSIKALKKEGRALAPFNISAKYSGTKVPIDYENKSELSKVKMKSPSAQIKKQLARKANGTYIYLASLANGYHSITIIVNKKGSTYEFLWKDQNMVQPYKAKEFDHKVLRYQGGVSHNDFRVQYNKNNKTSYDSADDIPKGAKYTLAAKMSIRTTKKNIKVNQFALLLSK